MSKYLQCNVCKGVGLVKCKSIICKSCKGKTCISCNSTGLERLPYVECHKCYSSGTILPPNYTKEELKYYNIYILGQNIGWNNNEFLQEK